MSIPNVLAALALTESGSKAVKASNPFPGLLKLFRHPKYAMPRSKCLLNEMTSIVGTGLDEIMRHVPSLKQQVSAAIANAMMEIVSFASSLAAKEECIDILPGASPTELDNERSCLMQYALNFGQILEQILHNEEHCGPFVEEGGLDAILKLYPFLMPSGVAFLEHVSCLSCPAAGTLCHSTTEDSLSLSFKCIALRYDSLKLLRKTIECTNQHFEQLEKLQQEMRANFSANGSSTDQSTDASFVLDGVPRQPIYEIVGPDFVAKKKVLSKYLRQIATVHWHTSLLAVVIKASCQRSQEVGSGWSRSEREWKKELASPEFQSLFSRLSTLFQSASMEVCRIRTENGFEERDLKRRNFRDFNVRYKLRIVCTEGAIVRDGIGIDDAASVGSMEMGEIVEAFDRCINSSGVLRYRTKRGWVSEHTRGHGREPIAEVLSIWVSPGEGDSPKDTVSKRVESGIPDLCTSSASVLARLQTSFSEIFSSLSRVGLQSIRTLSSRSISFDEGTICAFISTLMRMLQNEISKGLGRPEVLAAVVASDRDKDGSPLAVNKKGVSMFLGILLNHLLSFMFEEKRDRRTLNLPLLIPLADHHFKRDEGVDSDDANQVTLFDAISFIFEMGLEDFETGLPSKASEGEHLPFQSLSRTTASTLPPAMAMLRRLLSGPSITSSPFASVLVKFKGDEVKVLLGEREQIGSATDSSSEAFSPESFARKLYSCISDAVVKPWNDPRFGNAPAHVVHPLATLASETIVALDESTRTVPATSSSSTSRENAAAFNPFRSMLQNLNRGVESSAQGNDFEPSEDAISQLMEMGFTRDHSWEALDNVRTNRVEAAMEYALAHPASSSEVIERRRSERANRRRQREEQQQQQQAEQQDNNGDETVQESTAQGSDNPESMDIDQSQEAAKEEAPKDVTIEGVSSRINAWKENGPKIACNILAASQRNALATHEGDAESEALTMVLSSFLVDVYQRFTDSRDDIIKNLLFQLGAQLAEAVDVPGKISSLEASIAALCHCTVILIRALPKIRTKVLNEGIVSRTVSLVSRLVKEPGNEVVFGDKSAWPLYLSPSLLLLDVMAQPMVAFSVENDAPNGGHDEGESDELRETRNEHFKNVAEIASLAQNLFTALNKKNSANDLEHQKSNMNAASEENKKTEDTEINPEVEKGDVNFFKSVPPFYPLLPPQCVEPCADICLSLLGRDKSPPPGVAQATLMLLLRLLRDPRISSHCLSAGAGEKILALSKSSRFTGHSGLCTLIFRRLSEDSATLQSAMETEIKSIVSKMDGKRDKFVEGEKEKSITVPRQPFLDAVTPLLCRDPASFVKAMAVSAAFEKDTSDDEWRVCLLNSTQRARNVKIVSETLQTKSGLPLATKSATRRKSTGSKHKKTAHTDSGTRSKTPTRSHKRSHTPKRSKKAKAEAKEKHEDDGPKHQNSPIAQVTWLLINHIIQWSVPGTDCNDTRSFDFGSDVTFLWTGDALNVLADLALAVPSCAISIHKFKANKSNRALFHGLSNALQACPSPPRTFVSFLMHGVLSQDRGKGVQKVNQNPKSQDDALAQKQKKAANSRLNVVQAGARLLITLVARPGEGRRRVISELVFALSGGQLGASSGTSTPAAKTPAHLRSSELHALKAWGELSIGFAAPRSNGNSFDGNGSLSFEVIKLMLENGMAHALLVAMHRVPLHHPLASITVGALVLPFEILTRSSVADVVKTIAEKEASAKESKSMQKSTKQDDHMLEDAFAADASLGHQVPFMNSNQEHLDVEEEADDDAIIDDGHDEMMDADEENEDMSQDDSSSEGSESSDEDSDSDPDRDDDEESEDDSDSDSDDSDGDSSIIEDPEEAGGFDEEGLNVDFRGDVVADDDDFEDDENGGGQADGFIEDGWTNVEDGQMRVGGMILGGRRPGGGALNVAAPGRGGRGFADAAEAMIGQLLRSGEIPQEALAEIEGTLGIRIVQPNGNAATGNAQGNGGASFFRGSTRSARPESRGGSNTVGLLPQVLQRNQPDFGYTSIGGGSRWNGINSMEYVYGGPSVTAGNRNYDLMTPVEDPSDDNLQTSSPASIADTQPLLFPGGPAVATRSRPQTSVHPLLVGVSLPPENSLVSDLRPHGVIARSTASATAALRNPAAQRGFVISTNGSGAAVTQVVRSNTPQNNTQLLGWADDGASPDNAAFATAFENAMEQSMTAAALAEETNETDSHESHVGDDNSGNAVEEPADDEPVAAEPGSPSDQIEDGDVPMEDTQNGDDDDAGVRAAPSNEEGMASAEDAEQEVHGGDTNDGDGGVASSLAEALRLSPGHEGESNAEEQSDAAEEDDGSGDEEMVDVNETEAPENQDGNDASNPSHNPAADEATGQEVANPDPSNVEEAQPSEENADGDTLVCPPGMDEEVFNVLPVEMQMEVIREARETSELSAQLDAGSSLDPEALAALPEDVRREVIAQDQRERRMRDQAPADPSNAEEMDNASFLASLAPDLRNEILLTADDEFIASLPPMIVAEAQVLRERARADHRVLAEQANEAHRAQADGGAGGGDGNHPAQGNRARDNSEGHSRRKQRAGKIRVELDRDEVTYIPSEGRTSLASPIAKSDMKALLGFLYLLSPVRPAKLLQKVFHNIAMNGNLRGVLLTVFLKLLQNDAKAALTALDSMEKLYKGPEDWRAKMDELFEGSLQDFPPRLLIGTAPEVLETDGLNPSIQMMRRQQTSDTAASIAANLPVTSRGSKDEQCIPPVVATRMIDALQHLCKHSGRFCLDVLVKGLFDKEDSQGATGFESLLDMLGETRYLKSSTDLEQLLSLLELAVTPLSHLPKQGEEIVEISQRDIDVAASQGKAWADVPKIVISQRRLRLLCDILKMETCKDVSFTKVNTITRRLCRVDANRGFCLAELASVARVLSEDAIRDLRALSIRMSAAVSQNAGDIAKASANAASGTSASTSVAVSTSTAELKLLRVLQTLQSLCTETAEDTRRNDGPVVVSDEMVQLLEAMKLGKLWEELSACLKIVQVLEGVSIEEDADKKAGENNDGETDEQNENTGGKKLQNSVAGLLSRFLPSIESFFLANACTKASHLGEDEEHNSDEDSGVTNLVGGAKMIEFVEANKVLINAIIRTNSSLLDKGLRSLIQAPRLRILLDFDVKRHWFKQQVRRLRQQASRRHGSLRLVLRRSNLFEDAYAQLRLRNSEEMRGRLHITFRNEQGVDAGGLSREFFGILAKEIFNPNYALFTSTEDGSTFQPNPNSSINPDHLSYFRFVGRIVGKAVSDGYLLDAHFTRSLYKHMLGIKPTHHDMEAIDPDYYKNLKTILEYNLGDLGLDLTFSIEDHSFGRNQTLDLIENGRNVPVTEDNKAKYVSLVCQNRMTTAIKSQIQAYLDGFYELVSKDLIQVFTPRELELLISGLPDIDVLDLKKNTDYVGWKSSDQQIEWFWNVLFTLSRNQKASFLQFVTGSSKVPLAGFGELPGMRGVQKFSIHKVGGSSGALMSAHTCFNSLDLPTYKSEDELREKLLYAINEGGGAFLLA